VNGGLLEVRIVPQSQKRQGLLCLIVLVGWLVCHQILGKLIFGGAVTGMARFVRSEATP
jgi:hypothetical protein